MKRPCSSCGGHAWSPDDPSGCPACSGRGWQSDAMPADGSDLATVLAFLGWQGGTRHQAEAELERRLRGE